MTIDELICMLERKIVNLSSLLTSAKSLGDLERLTFLENEIASAQATLDQLKTL
jgi:hypothetical protein